MLIEKLRNLSSCFERQIITESEFASVCVSLLIDQPDHDPLPALRELPEPHQQLIVARFVEFANTDYYGPATDGVSGQHQREYQSQARIVCKTILDHFSA